MNPLIKNLPIKLMFWMKGKVFSTLKYLLLYFEVAKEQNLGVDAKLVQALLTDESA